MAFPQLKGNHAVSQPIRADAGRRRRQQRFGQSYYVRGQACDSAYIPFVGLKATEAPAAYCHAKPWRRRQTALGKSLNIMRRCRAPTLNVAGKRLARASVI